MDFTLKTCRSLLDALMPLSIWDNRELWGRREDKESGQRSAISSRRSGILFFNLVCVI
jgi:hypothetical protein